MSKIYYFAYGSNMSTRRLVARVSSAQVVCVAKLSGHRLGYHKKSHDGSAKCDAEFTDDINDVVHGVVFEIAATEKPVLDRYEGVGKGYEVKSVSVLAESDHQMDVFLYYATHIDRALKPYEWYREHVTRGALEHGIPQDYIRRFIDVDAAPDENRERHDNELAIYR